MITKSNIITIKETILSKYPNSRIEVCRMEWCVWFERGIKQSFLGRLFNFESVRPDCTINSENFSFNCETENVAKKLESLFPDKDIHIVNSYYWYDWTGGDC